jgi:hypothetical protein
MAPHENCGAAAWDMEKEYPAIAASLEFLGLSG